MTNNEILKADLLDILFEHRNKSYGAYALRRYYNNRLLIALSISLSAVLLLFFISLLKGTDKQNSSWLPPDDRNIVKLIDLKTDEPKQPERPRPPEKPKPVAQIKDVIPLIVPDIKAPTDVPEQKDIETREISIKTIDGPPAADLNKGATNINSTSTDSKGSSKQPEDFVPVEVQPSFPGGPEALALFFSRTLSSPTDLEAGEKKVILVRFVVGADGSITKAEIIQSGGDSYDKEVLRAFKRMPRWNPAIQNGSKVATAFTQPVTFIGEERQ